MILGVAPCLQPDVAPTFEFEAGLGGWTEALATQLTLGPTWQIRGGLDVLRWFGVDLNYSGMLSQARADSLVPRGRVLNTSVFVDARFVLKGHGIEPYAYGGAGYNWNPAWGSSLLRSTSSPIVAVGAGADVDLGRGWSVGFEGTFQKGLGGGSLIPTSPADGLGDNWNIVAGVTFAP